VRRLLRGVLAAALLAPAILAIGCGGSGATRFSGTALRAAGGGGTLRFAIPSAPARLDPLRAATSSDQYVDRQLFEPLVATLDGPYASARGRPGLALGWRHSGDFRIWSFRLRAGVRFQDGTPFNANVVLANAERWRAIAQGRALLPGLVAADAPRPDLARLILSEPLRDLPRRLADSRLGLVSPSALRPGGAPLSRVAQAGSGPFLLAERSPEQVSLTRYRAWWGSSHGLGPALDAIVFSALPEQAARVRVLRQGEVRVASELDRRAAETVRSDPLLTVVSARSGHALGLERSVRGIDGIHPQSLAGVWLALVGQTG
jgi:peptide/nickel transport system substrate-binding protein